MSVSIDDKMKKPDEKISVLVLDDEQEIVDTVIDILGDEGYDLQGFIDPKAALSSIEKGKYDVILTDLVMPGLTGIDIANFVNEKKVHTLVIVITAYATVDSAIQAVQLGVHNYIKKPFNQDDLKIMIKQAAEKIQLQKRNKYLVQKNQQMIDHITLLCEISSILYQVKDTGTASNMILDTLEEYFNVRRAAVALKDEDTDKYRLVNARNLQQSFVEDFTFSGYKKINDTIVSETDLTQITNISSEIKSEGRKIPSPDIDQMFLLPVTFYNELTGYILLFFSADDPPLQEEDLKLMKILSIQISPVFHGLQGGMKVKIEIEEQLDRLVNNFLFDSQSILQPISFALFRISILEMFDNHVQLEDLLENYKAQFKRIIDSSGQVIWITMDTVLVVLPGSDYFHAESKCADLKENIESITMHNDEKSAFRLSYSCIGYPQSGEDLSNITRDLWNKLLYEHFMFNQTEELGTA